MFDKGCPAVSALGVRKHMINLGQHLSLDVRQGSFKEKMMKNEQQIAQVPTSARHPLEQDHLPSQDAEAHFEALRSSQSLKLQVNQSTRNSSKSGIVKLALGIQTRDGKEQGEQCIPHPLPTESGQSPEAPGDVH